MQISEKKIAANRTNGRKSQGPTDTALTRHNATKHGLLAEGVTELDDAEGYHSTLARLMEETSPVGTIEVFLVKSAALEMVRCNRAARLEAEYITSILNPVTRGPGLGLGDELLEGEILRYATTSARGFFRVIHELERRQRMRRGENVPPPVTVDLSVHADTAMDTVVSSLPESKALEGHEAGK